jgi:hypothetical protein
MAIAYCKNIRESLLYQLKKYTSGFASPNRAIQEAYLRIKLLKRKNPDT